MQTSSESLQIRTHGVISFGLSLFFRLIMNQDIQHIHNGLNNLEYAY